jgi:hypothetical protein
MWVNVEPKIFDAREALQNSRWTASDIDHFIARFGPDMTLNDSATRRISAHDSLKDVVQTWDFQTAQ